MNAPLLTLKVAHKADEAVDICSFVLVDPSGKSLPAFSAGSHIDVHGPSGLVRQYSLCNAANETAHYQIGVLRDPGSRGGSVAMHDGIQEGDLLHVSEPRNHFPLEHAAKRSLLLAGGIGVTPILCMAESLSSIGAPFEMHYCTRSRQRTAFAERISTSAFSAQVMFHFDDGPDDQKLDIVALLRNPDPETHLYVCGPAGFLEFVLSTARAQGWQAPFIHYEYFGAAVGGAEEDKAFDVKINSTGRVYRIAADKSVAVALAERGVEIPVSCEQGVCGTCVTRVLEGELDHRDHYFTDAEHARNDQFTPCCSRSKGEMLVLDL
ncbi:2Fe-2S iron-sulfur cluster-binding protein [Cupriavidus sp. 2TAF22]|uniref:PDR/VanB family oxidoreductase n=1 Tax=unclassified Cupriavidus TaxID=2640874 RepID=UPI003F8E546B